jgi:hypothetical protein
MKRPKSPSDLVSNPSRQPTTGTTEKLAIDKEIFQKSISDSKENPKKETKQCSS